MATTFGSGELTLALTEQALGDALEVNWLIVRTFKGADLCSVGETGVEVGSDFPLLGGESKLFGPCNLEEVFAIGSNTRDRLFFAYGSGISTGGLTVVQPTAEDLLMTNTPAGWTPSVELAVGTNVVKASPGILHGFLVETGGTNDITVQFYNHASTATTPITPSFVVAGEDNRDGAMNIDAICSVGIVCVHSGVGGIVTAYFK